MSPPGRMEQGLEQRGVARAVHEPARANGAGLGAKRGVARAVHEPERANGARLGAKRGAARAVHEPARANGAGRKTLSFCT